MLELSYKHRQLSSQWLTAGVEWKVCLFCFVQIVFTLLALCVEPCGEGVGVSGRESTSADWGQGPSFYQKTICHHLGLPPALNLRVPHPIEFQCGGLTGSRWLKTKPSVTWPHFPCSLYYASVAARQMYWTMWVTGFMAMGDAVTLTELLKVQVSALRELQEPTCRGFSTCGSRPLWECVEWPFHGVTKDG